VSMTTLEELRRSRPIAAGQAPSASDSSENAHSLGPVFSGLHVSIEPHQRPDARQGPESGGW
jgi:hypothetical protein